MNLVEEVYSSKTETQTISVLSLRLKQAEIVLSVLQALGFGWLLIILFQVLTGPPSIVEYPASYGSQYGIWIQGVQFSQLVLALTIGGAASLGRTMLAWVPSIVRRLRKR